MGSLSSAEPLTSPSLLIRIRDSQDHEAWRSFSRLYGALIFNFCRSRGLQDQDAAEVMQETLLQIAKSIQTFEYQRERGRFRGWVGNIVRCKLVEFYRSQKRRPNFQAAPLDEISASIDGSWNDVWLEHVVHAALSRVEARLAEPTWQAFRLVWLEHNDPTDVAMKLNRDVAWVYLAKSRGLSLLREEVSFLADEPIQQIESRSGRRHALSHNTPAAD